MDRHELVAKLIKERDSLSEKISELNKNITFQKRRTKEAIMDFGSSDAMTLSCGGINYHSFCASDIKFPENEMVSDEAIKKLYGEILEKEKTVEDLGRTLAELRQNDFVEFLQYKLNENRN